MKSKKEEISRNQAIKDPKTAAQDLARSKGVALAPTSPPVAVARPDDPYGLFEQLEAAGAADGAVLRPSPGEGARVPGMARHYCLHLAPVPADAPKPAKGLRELMPEVASLIDWLRTWVPEKFVKRAVANLWAGSGYVIDEGATLGVGEIPRDRWRCSQPNERGLRRVLPR